ncbi:hypothetical protein V6N12_035760 [Hibiscus sabdariffa]|uniref:RNase H type-1 domain-containing protein n=1 Tax=Hibiscus sabdariffa TaxID=183260 RepID=A0ABR2EP27_9ROSI
MAGLREMTAAEFLRVMIHKGRMRGTIVIGRRMLRLSSIWRQYYFDLEVNFGYVSNQEILKSEGHVLAAGSQLNSNILDPTTTHAISTLQALKFASDIGFHKIVLEGDSFTVIKKLRSFVEDISFLTAVISEAKARLGDFHVSYCSFVLRMANQIAHAMAKEGWNVA